MDRSEFAGSRQRVKGRFVPIHGHGRCGGEKASPEYGIWNAMKSRCNNPNNEDYHLYGGRGITVCDRWEASFEDFLADMGPRPGPDFSIDREDNNLGYTPDNCRWLQSKEQARNRRSNVYVEIDGKRMLLLEAAEKAGIAISIVRQRLRYRWPLEQALSPIVGIRRYKRRPV